MVFKGSLTTETSVPDHAPPATRPMVEQLATAELRQAVLEAAAEVIRSDSQQAPAAYLDESIAPFGGE